MSNLGDKDKKELSQAIYKGVFDDTRNPAGVKVAMSADTAVDIAWKFLKSKKVEWQREAREEVYDQLIDSAEMTIYGIESEEITDITGETREGLEFFIKRMQQEKKNLEYLTSPSNHEQR